MWKIKARKRQRELQRKQDAADSKTWWVLLPNTSTARIIAGELGLLVLKVNWRWMLILMDPNQRNVFARAVHLSGGV